MTGWNLPPGCTDADIDRAARGDPDYRCDECEGYFYLDEVETFTVKDPQNGEDVHFTICRGCDKEGWKPRWPSA